MFNKLEARVLSEYKRSRAAPSAAPSTFCTLIKHYFSFIKHYIYISCISNHDNKTRKPYKLKRYVLYHPYRLPIFESTRWKFHALIYCCHLTSSWCYLDCWQPINIRRSFLGKIKKVCFRLFSVSMQYSIYIILNHVNEVDFTSVCVTLFYIISKLHILILPIIGWSDDFTFGCYPIKNYIWMF